MLAIQHIHARFALGQFARITRREKFREIDFSHSKASQIDNRETAKLESAIVSFEFPAFCRRLVYF